jgi:tape measure domain-containing protein
VADIKKLGIEIGVSGAKTAITDMNAFKNATGQAEVAVESFEAEAKTASSTIGGTLSGSLKTASSTMSSIGAKMSVAITVPVTLAAKSFVQLSMQMDSASIALTRMIGSGGKAKDLLADLKRFGSETPFEFGGLVETTKMLIGFGVPANDVIEKLGMLGNAAGGNQQKLDQLALAYGKVQVKGVAMGENINMFLEAGVPLTQELAKMFGTTTLEIDKMVSAGKIGFKDVDRAIKNLTTGSGKFAGILEDQSKSLQGILSNLGDSFGQMGASIVKSFQPVIEFIVSIAQTMINVFTALPSSVQVVITMFIGFLAVLGPILLIVGQLAPGFILLRTALTTLLPIIATMGSTLWASLAPIMPILAATAALVGVFYLAWKSGNDEIERFNEAQNTAKTLMEDTIPVMERYNIIKAEETMKTISNTIAILEEQKALALRQGANQALIEEGASGFSKGQIEGTNQSIREATKLYANLEIQINGLIDRKKVLGKLMADDQTTLSTNELIYGSKKKNITDPESGSTGGGSGKGGGTVTQIRDMSTAYVSAFQAAKKAALDFNTVLEESIFNSLSDINESLVVIEGNRILGPKEDYGIALGLAEAEQKAGRLKLTIAELGKELVSGAISSAMTGFNEFGEALGKGSNKAEAFMQALSAMASQMLKMLPLLFLQAGLSMIAQGNYAIGLGFIAASASSAIVGGFVEGRKANKEKTGTANSASGNAFSNSIVDTNTRFASGGVTGRMGENNPEAIIPLKRDAQGRLGVSGAGGGANVQVNIINNSNGTVEQKETTDSNGNKKIDVIIREAVSAGISAGQYNKELRSQFKLQSAGI